MADDIVTRLYCSYADPPCEQCTFCAARAEIERLRTLCFEAQQFIKHNTNCGAVTDWGKNCSCGHDEMWKKLNV